MKIQILHYPEDADKIKGLTVIIQVFCGTTAQAYLLNQGLKELIAIYDRDKAYNFSTTLSCPICGEYNDRPLPWSMYNDAPAELFGLTFTIPYMVHTTPALKGVEAAAVGRREVLCAALVNAKATAEYIRQRKPDTVSLVCMGFNSTQKCEADMLCAKYIKSILENTPIRNMRHLVNRLKYIDGPVYDILKSTHSYPAFDYLLSTYCDQMDFVMKVDKHPEFRVNVIHRVDVTYQQRKPRHTRVKKGDMLSKFTKVQVRAFPESVKAAIAYQKLPEAEGSFDAVLLLGGNPSVQRSRAEAAVRLYKEGRCKVIMPTGGVKWVTRFGYLSECDSLSRWLMTFGVPDWAISREAAATTTRENMTCAKKMLAAEMPLEAARIAVVTSRYHLRRSMMLAKAYIPEAQIFGIAAEDPMDNPECYIQEPRLVTALSTECICLYNAVKQGLIPDFPVL